ncbi:carboxypeptidase M32, partial [bacterium]|nr:carboxypeptidase M32 [bacterium]
VGQLIEDLAPLAGSLPAESDDACLLRVTQRDYQKATRVTSEWVSAYARVTAVAQQHWQNAKAASDFEQFRPDLETILDLRRQYAEFFKPFEHVYDPLLDDFEPGLKTAEVQSIFSALRPQQIELLRAIKNRPQVENRFLYQPFDAEKQWTFGVEVISKYGYNWERGRQDKSVHPFTTSLGWGDVRITTRVDPNYLGTGMFGTFHEAGHGMYEQGIAPSLRRTALCSGASMAVHESQSRMWENLVGRSLPFWQHFYPRLQELFPTQLGAVSLDQFYRGINKVEPSFIRVEADEATYNLHIMLRLELEIALMEGSLAVKDLPAAWNERMQEYLGVTPPDNAHGVPQAGHWSRGRG